VLSVKAFTGLKGATVFSSNAQKLSNVQNGSRVQCMQVLAPTTGIVLLHCTLFLPSSVAGQESRFSAICSQFGC
jgi:hypothetical protein